MTNKEIIEAINKPIRVLEPGKAFINGSTCQDFYIETTGGVAWLVSNDGLTMEGNHILLPNLGLHEVTDEIRQHIINYSKQLLVMYRLENMGQC